MCMCVCLDLPRERTKGLRAAEAEALCGSGVGEEDAKDEAEGTTGEAVCVGGKAGADTS